MQLVRVERAMSAGWSSQQPICQSAESPFSKLLGSPSLRAEPLSPHFAEEIQLGNIKMKAVLPK